MISLKALLLFPVLVCLTVQPFAQKKRIDFNSLDSWEWFAERSISNDGKWVSYSTAPNASHQPQLQLIHLPTQKKLSFGNASRCWFSPDNLVATFTLHGPNGSDTTVIVHLPGLRVIKLQGIKAFMLPANNSGRFAFLANKNDIQTLFVKSLDGKELMTKENVSEFWWLPSGNGLIYQSKSKSGESLIFETLASGMMDTVSKQAEILGNGSFDARCNRFAFAFRKKSQDFIGIYDLNFNEMKAIPLTDISPSDYQLAPQTTIRFTDDNNVLFSLIYNYGFRRHQPAGSPKVEVWSYADDRIYPLQKKQLDKELNAVYYFNYSLQTGRLTQITDLKVNEFQMPSVGSEVALIYTQKPYLARLQWDPVIRRDAYILDIKTGSRCLIAKNTAADFELSPSGKFVVWFDKDKQYYYSYQVEKKLCRQIDFSITDALANQKLKLPKPSESFGIACWEEGDKSLLINTEFDVWKADPFGDKQAQNVTMGYARRHRINFRFYASLHERRTYFPDDTLLFFGTSSKTREAGFFAVQPSSAAEPRKLIFGKYSFTYPGMAKAKDSRDVLLSFGSTDFYGLFHSNDLIHFDTVHLLNPQQKDFNWYTSEYVQWNDKNGNRMEGRIYKPEDFDTSKKYPLLIWIYENDQVKDLYSYIMPRWSAAIVDFAFYASNGYIVFIPDIAYKIGKPGESALETVLSGIEHLGRFSWVDKDNIGIQGHSWGGYQVSYIISRTNKIKAAVAGAAVSNMTSAYGAIRSNTGESRHWIYERDQSRLGVSLWQQPSVYIENSPLFRADKINTPLLLVHNEKDGAVPFAQSVELYSALKRLGKKVWLINYPDENHVLAQLENKKDFTKRMFYFFEHYLKWKPAPLWINTGVPALQEGFAQGY